jgi:hypothetical protein
LLITTDSKDSKWMTLQRNCGYAGSIRPSKQ